MVREVRRIHRELTPNEQARLERYREQVAQELPDLIARDQLRKSASEEDTPSGALRRAIHQSDLLLPQIANHVAITLLELDQFLTAEAPLPSDVIDRLAEALGSAWRRLPSVSGRANARRRLDIRTLT